MSDLKNITKMNDSPDYKKMFEQQFAKAMVDEYNRKRLGGGTPTKSEKN